MLERPALADRLFTKETFLMPRISTFVLVTFCIAAPTAPLAQTAKPARTSQSSAYFPERFEWQHKRPADVGMNSALVDEAVNAAIAAESQGSKVMQNYLVESYSREPFDTPIGPIKDRGAASGLVVHRGYIVAEWGDPSRVDMTFSVTKT